MNAEIAIVHDWLCEFGGGEKVMERFCSCYPGAPVYTSICIYENLTQGFKNTEIKTSYLQKKHERKLRKNNRIHISLFPFMPFAFESFDLNAYDIVLSSSTSCAKGVVTNPLTMHICYCNSPMRYAWEMYYEYIKDYGRIKKSLIKYLMNYMKIWDVISSNRVDYFIANSENVANRIWKHYRRESAVIHPPADIDFFNPVDYDDEYFLCVSRLFSYKKIDLAVRTFNETGQPLVIIGDGPEMKHIKSIAKPNIKLLGRQPDDVVKEHFAKCRAFIFPGEEDFGITPVEAQASGRPVIAFGKGGALETVINGETGLFFKEQTVDSLKAALYEFEKIPFSKDKCRTNAKRFGNEIFEKKITAYVDECYKEFRNNKHWKVI